MNYVKICVTSKVARAVTSGETYQRQITIKDRSPAVTEVRSGCGPAAERWWSVIPTRSGSRTKKLRRKKPTLPNCSKSYERRPISQLRLRG